MADSHKTIFFDEAGFTGDDLISQDQQIFAYAGVAIDKDKADSLAESVMSEFKIQGQELKAKNLVKPGKGRAAIRKIISSLDGMYSVFLANKQYALSGKFFEYIYEPVIQENNSLFYRNNFHRMIANLVYVFFKVKDADGQDALSSFQELMRTGNPGGASI